MMKTLDTRHLLFGTALATVALVGAPALAQVNPTQPPIAGQPGVESDGDGIDDDIDAEPCNINVASKRYDPADRTWGMLLFEDRWPDKGDFDFNDLVLGYNEILDYDSNNRLTGIRVDLRVIAVGARFTNGLAFRIPGAPKTAVTNLSLKVGGVAQNVSLRPSESDVVVTLANDLHALFAVSNQTWINTDPALTAKGYVDIVLEMKFAPGQNITASDAPFDIFIFNPTRGTEVHRPRYQGTSSIDGSLFGTADDGSAPGRAFVTRNGIPFVLDLPETALYPQEGVAIDALYPQIVDFGLGLPGSDTFYQNPVLAHGYGNISIGAFTTTAQVDVSCFTPNPGVCGSAANQGSVNAPTANLCSFGTASAVTASGGFHTWTCAGNYSTATACDAPDFVCSPNTTSACTINNGAGTQVCNGSGLGFGTCSLSTCNPGFYASGNSCLAQVCTPSATQSCAIANGTGTQQCNNLGSRWHDCTVASCNSGFEQVGNVCQATVGGGDVYYRCNGATNYIVFVENTNGISVNSAATHHAACLTYGFKSVGSTNNNHTVNNIGYNSADVLDASACNCCRVHSFNPWWWHYDTSGTPGANRDADDCTHVSGVATGATGKILSASVPDFVCANHGCQTFKQDLGPGTYFGDRLDTESHEPWYPSGQDPNCSGSSYSGTPDYLLCAAPSINVR